jgi:hypothetical protein
MIKPQSAPASVPIRYDLRGMGPGDLHPYRDQRRGTPDIDLFIGGRGSSDDTDLVSSSVWSSVSSTGTYPT